MWNNWCAVNTFRIHCLCFTCSYQTDAAGAVLHTPETLAHPRVRPGSRRTAASQTCKAAECPAWRWSTPGSLPPLHSQHIPYANGEEKSHVFGEITGDSRGQLSIEQSIVQFWTVAWEKSLGLLLLKVVFVALWCSKCEKAHKYYYKKTGNSNCHPNNWLQTIKKKKKRLQKLTYSGVFLFWCKKAACCDI